MRETGQDRPAISVVVEGYNESRELGLADDTVAALAAQDFPPERIEVILMGSAEQARHWRTAYADSPFHSVRAIACDSLQYFELKNEGAMAATGEIIAFTDSDVRPAPSWVSAIVDGIGQGAGVTVGASQFHKTGGLRMGPDHPVMRAAATITWGWVLGRRGGDGIPEPRGFVDHNMALRADLFRDLRYRTEFGRILASGFLFRDMNEAGLRVEVRPRQRAAHHFSWRYWLVGLQFRYGHEVYRLRRLNDQYPNQWIRKAGPLEPLATLAWHMMLDVPRWFRYTRLQDAGVLYRWGWFPLLLAMSAIARSSEALGMAATMITPERTRRWAENV